MGLDLPSVVRLFVRGPVISSLSPLVTRHPSFRRVTRKTTVINNVSKEQGGRGSYDGYWGGGVGARSEVCWFVWCVVV